MHCIYQLIMLLVLYRLNKKFKVQVIMQAKFVVSGVVRGSNYCFCGKEEWKWVDFNFISYYPSVKHAGSWV